MERTKAYVTPAVMKWARERAGLSVEIAAAKIGRSAQEIVAWEDGTLLPSLAQARKAAEAYKRSLAIFYLPEPPRDFQTLPDFRTFASAELATHSPELALLIRRLQTRQEWLHEFRLAEKYDPLSFIGSATVDANPSRLVDQIRHTLGITLEDQIQCRDTNETFNLIAGKAERVGVCICREGTVDIDEVRGIALTDSLAPFVFVNSKDSQSGRLFTLVHEISHLWINQPGLSNWRESNSEHRDAAAGIEFFCNQVASFFLLDPPTFQSKWRTWSPELPLNERIDAIAKSFKVSSEVVARRLLDLRQIKQQDYEQLRDTYRRRWLEETELRRQRQADTKGGPSPYLLRYLSNGKSFTQSVFSAASSGAITLRDASMALGVKVNHLAKMAKTAGLPPINANSEA